MVLIVLELAVFPIEDLGNAVANGPPGLFAVGDKIIQRILKKNIIGQRNVPEITQLVKGSQVYGRIPYSGADGDDVIPGKEYTKGDVLNRKVRIPGYRKP